MNHEKYPFEVSEKSLVFEFRSEGPNGVVIKQAKFGRMSGYDNVFNVALGDIDPKGNVNYHAVTNSSDSAMVLATVASIIRFFLNDDPDRLVYIEGSTKSRARLYRMAIARNLVELKNDFRIFGRFNDDYKEFQIGVDYQAFLIEFRKNRI